MRHAAAVSSNTIEFIFSKLVICYVLLKDFTLIITSTHINNFRESSIIVLSREVCSPLSFTTKNRMTTNKFFSFFFFFFFFFKYRMRHAAAVSSNTIEFIFSKLVICYVLIKDFTLIITSTHIYNFRESSIIVLSREVFLKCLFYVLITFPTYI